MCAISGIASNSKYINRDECSRMLKNMSHRGPDHRGYWISKEKNVFLGHNRLSIIDLSKNANQPMYLDNQEIVIVFNGEIYNYLEIKEILIKKGYKFFSKSDTEVIISAYKEWGYDFVKKIDGQFAFSIYDNRKKIIFSVRDRAGEKPFFYKFDGTTFQFASELKGIFSEKFDSTKINIKALDSFLTFGYVPGDLCILEGVKKLPPASALIFDLNKNSLKVFEYWQLPISNNYGVKNINLDSLYEEFDVLFKDSVKKQLVSDVPIGVLLSGGIDSSIIAYYAANLSKNIKTFNVSFKKFGDFDESSHARLVSKFLGTDHMQIDIDEPSPDLMFKLSKQFDEPISDSSIIPTFLLSQEVKKYCTVALGGDGGDELFGGYKHYDRLLWLERYLSKLPNNIKKFISTNITEKLPIGFKGKNWLQSLNTDLSNNLPIIGKFFSQNDRNKLTNNLLNLNFSENFWNERLPKENNLLERATRMDFKNYLAEDILVKIDRASMLNSLELRAPFLDKKIIEFAFGKIHPKNKCSSSERKIFLKKFVYKIFPKSFDIKRKQGFSIPLKNWFKKGKWRDLLTDTLLDSESFFNKEIVENIIKQHDKGNNNSERLFCLLNFELWRKYYKLSI